MEDLTIYNRGYSKQVIAFQKFIDASKSGKSAIYVTPGGNILSPKAVDQAIQTERERILGELEVEIRKFIQSIDSIYYPPSGKEYHFKDGSWANDISGMIKARIKKIVRGE